MYSLVNSNSSMYSCASANLPARNQIRYPAYTIAATNNNLSRFNKEAHHDSQRWYKSVISWYITEHGDLPSKIGPGKDVKLLYDI